jgi:hypothetical protein
MVDEKLKVILAAIHEVKDIAIETRDQARRTNGRVTSLEGKCVTKEEFEPIADWTKIAKGAVAVLVAIVLPILGFLAFEEQSLNVEVQAHIATMK